VVKVNAIADHPYSVEQQTNQVHSERDEPFYVTLLPWGSQHH
jgi:hypothetical protein